MTLPSPEKLESEKDKLYVTDAELIRRLGVPREKAKKTIMALDANPHSGFPKKDELWGDRRYWPAVLRYLDRMSGRTMEPSTNRRGSYG